MNDAWEMLIERLHEQPKDVRLKIHKMAYRLGLTPEQIYYQVLELDFDEKGVFLPTLVPNSVQVHDRIGNE